MAFDIKKNLIQTKKFFKRIFNWFSSFPFIHDISCQAKQTIDLLIVNHKVECIPRPIKMTSNHAITWLSKSKSRKKKNNQNNYYRIIQTTKLFRLYHHNNFLSKHTTYKNTSTNNVTFFWHWHIHCNCQKIASFFFL